MAGKGTYASSRTVEKGLDKDEAELPLREVEAARDYELTPRQWIDLRKRFQSEQEKTRLSNMEVQWKAEVEKSVRARLREEMLGELRARVDQETRDKAYEAAYAKIQVEERTKHLTTAQRDVAKEFLRDMEIECRALAETASQMANTDRRNLHRARILRTPLFLALLLGAAPFAVWLHTHGYPLPSITGAALLAPWVLFLILVKTRNDTVFEQLTKSSTNYAKASSDYLVLADQVRQTRSVDVDLAVTRDEMQRKIESIAGRKSRLDDQFHADTRLLQAARTTVLDDISRTIDPEKILTEDRKRIAAQYDQLAPLEDDEPALKRGGQA